MKAANGRLFVCSFFIYLMKGEEAGVYLTTYLSVPNSKCKYGMR